MGAESCAQLVWVFHNKSQRGENEEEKQTKKKKKTAQNKAIGKKSVKLGINNPFPQMPSIVPCLDKASKSGWKMQAPFLSVWNYYPFVLSQALLSSPSWVCMCVQTDSSAEVAEPKTTSQRGPCTHLMFDLATKLITMTPTELLRAWRGLTTDTTHQLVAVHVWGTPVFFLRLGPFSLCLCRWPPLSYLGVSRPLFNPFSPTLHSSCTPTHPLSLSFLPFCVFLCPNCSLTAF